MYLGSFDIWTRNHLADLVDITQDVFVDAPEPCIVGWVNGTNFKPSRETFGILPLSPSMKQTLGMFDFDPEFAKQENIRHQDLARHQQTRVAILPVNTSQERSLFRLLVLKPDGALEPSEPNWVGLATRWSKHCDGVKIFYKVCSLHFQAYILHDI